MELHEFGYQNETFHAVRHDRQMKNLTGKPWDELQEEDEKNTLGKPLGREDFDCALGIGEFMFSILLNSVKYLNEF